MADKSGHLSGAGSKKPSEIAIKFRKLHTGYHVEKKHPNGDTTEHSATDMDELQQHLQDHMGTGDDDSAAPPAALPGQAPLPTS